MWGACDASRRRLTSKASRRSDRGVLLDAAELAPDLIRGRDDDAERRADRFFNGLLDRMPKRSARIMNGCTHINPHERIHKMRKVPPAHNNIPCAYCTITMDTLRCYQRRMWDCYKNNRSEVIMKITAFGPYLSLYSVWSRIVPGCALYLDEVTCRLFLRFASV